MTGYLVECKTCGVKFSRNIGFGGLLAHSSTHHTSSNPSKDLYEKHKEEKEFIQNYLRSRDRSGDVVSTIFVGASQTVTTPSGRPASTTKKHVRKDDIGTGVHSSADLSTGEVTDIIQKFSGKISSKPANPISAASSNLIGQVLSVNTGDNKISGVADILQKFSDKVSSTSSTAGNKLEQALPVQNTAATSKYGNVKSAFKKSLNTRIPSNTSAIFQQHNTDASQPKAHTIVEPDGMSVNFSQNSVTCLPISVDTNVLHANVNATARSLRVSTEDSHTIKERDNMSPSPNLQSSCLPISVDTNATYDDTTVPINHSNTIHQQENTSTINFQSSAGSIKSVFTHQPGVATVSSLITSQQSSKEDSSRMGICQTSGSSSDYIVEKQAILHSISASKVSEEHKTCSRCDFCGLQLSDAELFAAHLEKHKMKNKNKKNTRIKQSKNKVSDKNTTDKPPAKKTKSVGKSRKTSGENIGRKQGLKKSTKSQENENEKRDSGTNITAIGTDDSFKSAMQEIACHNVPCSGVGPPTSSNTLNNEDCTNMTTTDEGQDNTSDDVGLPCSRASLSTSSHVLSKADAGKKILPMDGSLKSAVQKSASDEVPCSKDNSSLGSNVLNNKASVRSTVQKSASDTVPCSKDSQLLSSNVLNNADAGSKILPRGGSFKSAVRENASAEVPCSRASLAHSSRSDSVTKILSRGGSFKSDNMPCLKDGLPPSSNVPKDSPVEPSTCMSRTSTSNSDIPTEEMPAANSISKDASLEETLPQEEEEMVEFIVISDTEYNSDHEFGSEMAVRPLAYTYSEVAAAAKRNLSKETSGGVKNETIHSSSGFTPKKFPSQDSNLSDSSSDVQASKGGTKPIQLSPVKNLNTLFNKSSKASLSSSLPESSNSKTITNSLNNEMNTIPAKKNMPNRPTSLFASASDWISTRGGGDEICDTSISDIQIISSASLAVTSVPSEDDNDTSSKKTSSKFNNNKRRSSSENSSNTQPCKKFHQAGVENLPKTSTAETEAFRRLTVSPDLLDLYSDTMTASESAVEQVKTKQLSKSKTSDAAKKTKKTKAKRTKGKKIVQRTRLLKSSSEESDTGNLPPVKNTETANLTMLCADNAAADFPFLPNMDDTSCSSSKWDGLYWNSTKDDGLLPECAADVSVDTGDLSDSSERISDDENLVGKQKGRGRGERVKSQGKAKAKLSVSHRKLIIEKKFVWQDSEDKDSTTAEFLSSHEDEKISSERSVLQELLDESLRLQDPIEKRCNVEKTTDQVLQVPQALNSPPVAMEMNFEPEPSTPVPPVIVKRKMTARKTIRSKSNLPDNISEVINCESKQRCSFCGALVPRSQESLFFHWQNECVNKKL